MFAWSWKTSAATYCACATGILFHSAYQTGLTGMCACLF